MGLLSLFKNNMQKQEIPDDAESGEFHSRAEQDSKPVRGNGKRTTPNRKAKVVDPILPEKKRARRRLIGAVALVLAAVIGLPMVLDSEPKPIVDNISVQIPSKDKAPTLSEHVGVTAATSLALVAGKNKALPAEPVEEIIATSEKTAVEGPVKPVALTAKAEQKIAVPKLEAAAENKALVSAAAKSPTKPSTSVTEIDSAAKAQKKSETVDDATRAMAILEGKSTSKAPVNNSEKNEKIDKAEKTSSGYILQVAALATQEKVNELQNTLKAANIKSYTQKITTTSNEKIRIRVGPFETKEEAQKMQEKLVKAGLNGKILPN